MCFKIALCLLYFILLSRTIKKGWETPLLYKNSFIIPKDLRKKSCCAGHTLVTTYDMLLQALQWKSKGSHTVILSYKQNRILREKTRDLLSSWCHKVSAPGLWDSSYHFKCLTWRLGLCCSLYPLSFLSYCFNLRFESVKMGGRK